MRAYVQIVDICQGLAIVIVLFSLFYAAMKRHVSVVP